MTKEKMKHREALTITQKAFAISLKVRSPFSLFLGLVGFVMAFWPVFVSRRLSALTDEVVAMTEGRGSLDAALLIFAVLAVMLIAQGAYVAVSGYFAAADAGAITRYIRTTIIKIGCRVKYQHVENNEGLKQKIDFIQTEAGARVAASIQSLLSVLQGLMTVVSVTIVLGQVNLWLTIILLLSCLPSVVVSNRYQDAEYRQKTQWITEGVMVMHLFSNCFRPWRMKEIRSFGLYEYLKGAWKHKSLVYMQTKQALRQKYLGFNILADLIRNGVFIGVLLIASHEVFHSPGVGLGVFMLVFTLSTQLQDVMTSTSVKIVRFHEDITYMKDFFDLQQFECESYDEDAPVLETLDIACEDIHFAYPGASREALSGLSVKIKQGEKIAIVGHNGSGKSTFVNMLLGFYQPQSGSITVNGVDMQEALTSVRRSISAVFQEFGRYDDTIRENICVSDRQKESTDEDLIRIAEKTGAYAFIRTQPEGLDTMLGSFSKSGNNLSGGQWQKLALTRALYRSHAKMMILDEPTAALDPIAEAAIYRDFATLTEDKTTILISHRLGITSVVDRILVFDAGRIVEDGSHDQLLAQKGVYSKMYQAQAQWYQ